MEALLLKNILPTEEAICLEFASTDLDVAVCRAFLASYHRTSKE